MVFFVIVCDFLKVYYCVFVVFWEFIKEMEVVGVSVKELMFKMLRSLFKILMVVVVVFFFVI